MEAADDNERQELISLAKYSRVFPISRTDFTPAETTAIGARPSSLKSQLMSKVTSAPRWTPPIPPVDKGIVIFILPHIGKQAGAGTLISLTNL